MRAAAVAALLTAFGCQACGRVPQGGGAASPHVYLVVVDGLDARLATPAQMPRLFALVAGEPARTSIFPEAHAVMPARTNPNHVSLLTGAYPEAHGITGNAYWSREAGALPETLDFAALIEVETLFTVVEGTVPRLVTFGVFAKPKLARLFAAVPGRQRAPDVLWSSEELPPEGRDPATGYSFDAETMSAALARMAEAEPDLAVVGLADVDRTAHAFGSDSPECARAVAGADDAIGQLADQLHGLGRWSRSVVVVTADHGFTKLDPASGNISLAERLSAAKLGGVHVVADGGVEHVYADGPTPATEAAPALARVAALAAATPGVAEVLARLPVPGVASLASGRPDWHLAHERTGDLLLVAAPGRHFLDPFDRVRALWRGDHGGPGELTVPLIVTGGYAGLRAAPSGAPAPILVDVAPTVASLLGLRRPRRVDGSAVPETSAGRTISAVLAQSPH